MSHRLSIRWRLTLWYGALLAVSLAIFGVILYIGLRITLNNTFDDQLRTQADIVRSTVQENGGTLTFKPSENNDPTSGEHFLRLIDRQGKVVADTSTSLGGLQLDPALVAAARAGHTRLTSVSVGGETLRVITEPVMAGDQVVGVVQVGLFRSEIREALDQLLSLLIIEIPVVLLVAGIGGYLLARRALAPVATITSLAARISGTDLRGRLNLTLPDDDLGRLARTFDAMLARVEEAFERQRRFTGNAAHELRTPLSLMRSQIDLALVRPRSAEEYRDALREVDADLERLTRLVATLLTLSRADTGTLLPERGAFDLAETVGLVLEQYAGIADEQGVRLREDTQPAPLVADEDLIVQVLVNLLDNALTHTPAGGEITVGCRAGPDGTTFWIADTGSGIRPEHLQRVFDRFYRADFGRARGHGGVGLGLSICQAIVEAHGGVIGIDSSIGHGTRVDVYLPATGRDERPV